MVNFLLEWQSKGKKLNAQAAVASERAHKHTQLLEIPVCMELNLEVEG